MVVNLTIEMLSEGTDYNFEDFDCGEPSLNIFLKEHLVRQHNGRILRGYLLKECHRPHVLGYYTLSGSCFEKTMLPSSTQQRRIPYSNVPSVTLGRLAIHKALQGNEWGTTLVAHAMRVVYLASQAVGVHGIFVDALNEQAQRFYLKQGFIPLKGENSNALFFPTKSIERLFEQE
ncbi:GNAT family N-acetyltransferase [Enterobacter pasteurii]